MWNGEMVTKCKAICIHILSFLWQPQRNEEKRKNKLQKSGNNSMQTRMQRVSAFTELFIKVNFLCKIQIHSFCFIKRKEKKNYNHVSQHV